MPPPSSAAAKRGAPGPAPQPRGAAPSNKVITGHIKQLQDMGFSEAVAKKAFAECNWDVNKALDLLFSRGGFLGDEDPVVGDSKSSKPAALDPLPSETVAPKASRNRGAEDPAETSTTASAPSVSASSSPRTNGQEKQAVLPAEAGAPVAKNEDAMLRQAPATEGTPQKEACVAPQKRLERVGAKWQGDKSPIQHLFVEEGEFVLVWPGTATENGWTFAETFGDRARCGWLPTLTLSVCPENTTWMRCTKGALSAHTTTMDVLEGDIVRVNCRSRTREGWVFVEKQMGSGVSSPMSSGWVPVFCLEWTED